MDHRRERYNTYHGFHREPCHGTRWHRPRPRAAEVAHAAAATVAYTAVALAATLLLVLFLLPAIAGAQDDESNDTNYNTDGMAEPEEGFDSGNGDPAEPGEQQDEPSNGDGSAPDADVEDVRDEDSEGDEGADNGDAGGEDDGGDGLTTQQALDIVEDLGNQAPEECEAVRITRGPGATDGDDPQPEDVTDECLQALQELQDEDTGDPGTGDDPDSGQPSDDEADTRGPGSTGDDTADDEGSDGVIGLMTSGVEAILRRIYDLTFGWMLQNNAENMRESYLPLPEISGEADALYSGLVETVRPALLVGTLILALMMMVRTTHYDLAYATLTGLPKLLGIGVLLAFLPEFMQMVTVLSNGISEGFFPSEYQIDEAGFTLYQAALSNLAFTNFLNVILLIMLAVIGFLVIIVAVLKNIFFILLFISAPFALIGSLIPGVSSLAASWFKGVLACAAIPSLWAIQLGVGAFIVRNPESVFGGYVDSAPLSEGVAVGIGAILILWIMWKTPFKVLEWAFASYSTSGGMIRGLGKTAMFATVAMASRGALSAAAGAMKGGGGSAGNIGGAASQGASPGGGVTNKIGQSKGNSQAFNWNPGSSSGGYKPSSGGGYPPSSSSSGGSSDPTDKFRNGTNDATKRGTGQNRSGKPNQGGNNNNRGGQSGND